MWPRRLQWTTVKFYNHSGKLLTLSTGQAAVAFDRLTVTQLDVNQEMHVNAVVET